MDEETKKLLREIQNNPSSGVSHDAKMASAQVEEIFALNELTEEVKELKGNLATYSAAAERVSRLSLILTIALVFFALLQIGIAIKQTNLTEAQGIPGRINQNRAIEAAIERCNQDKELKESGLSENSSGKPATCKEILQRYDSIQSRIERFFGLIN